MQDGIKSTAKNLRMAMNGQMRLQSPHLRAPKLANSILIFLYHSPRRIDQTLALLPKTELRFSSPNIEHGTR